MSVGDTKGQPKQIASVWQRSHTILVGTLRSHCTDQYYAAKKDQYYCGEFSGVSIHQHKVFLYVLWQLYGASAMWKHFS